jgi:hypothetical protein
VWGGSGGLLVCTFMCGVRSTQHASHDVSRAVFLTGTDATDAFDDIGHSNGAKKQLVEKCECMGELVGAPEKKSKGSSGGGAGGEGGVGIAGIIVPVVVMAILAFLVQKFM